MKRGQLPFIGLCVAAFVLFGVGTAFGMIWTIDWYLSNCSAASTLCTAASWLIDYWWALFVPVVMASAAGVYVWREKSRRANSAARNV